MQRYKVQLVIALTAIVASTGTSGCSQQQQTPVAERRDTGQPAKADSVVFFDDFSGGELDRSKWNVRVTGQTVNDEQQAYVDSAATLYLAQGEEAAGAADGALVIRPVYSPNFVTPESNTFDFISGRIDTRDKVMFTYGTAAARMKLPAGTGLWPAFWALGAGRWPDTGEIDIMEYVGETDWTSVALHGPGYFGETPLVNKAYLSADNDVTQWHVYAVAWTPDSLIFTLDDKLVYRATRPMVEHYGKWAFDNPKFLILNLALGGAYPVKINGVKAPYNGLPAATVQLIKDDSAKVLVDWVRITR